MRHPLSAGSTPRVRGGGGHVRHVLRRVRAHSDHFSTAVVIHKRFAASLATWEGELAPWAVLKFFYADIRYSLGIVSLHLLAHGLQSSADAADSVWARSFRRQRRTSLARDWNVANLAQALQRQRSRDGVEDPEAAESTRPRVAHLRHGLLPVAEVVAKRGVRVQTASPDDENEKFYQADVQLETCREEPLLDTNHEEYDIELTKLQPMKDFGVDDEVHVGDGQESYSRDSLSPMWVKRPKGSETRCRLGCKRCYQETADKDDAHASAPLLTSLKLLLLIGPTKNYCFTLYDASTASMPNDVKRYVFAPPPRLPPPLNFTRTAMSCGDYTRRRTDSRPLQASRSYATEMFDLLALRVGNSVNTTGASSTPRRENGTSIVSAAPKLCWLEHIRPDLSYVAKELGRTLSSPADDDVVANLKHASRCLESTRAYRMSIVPKDTAGSDDSIVVTTFAETGWAGWTTTRNSTTGCTITVRGVAVHHYSRTETTVALSSGEAELYGLSTGTTEIMGVLQFLRECNFKTNGFVAMAVDSTAGK